MGQGGNFLIQSHNSSSTPSSRLTQISNESSPNTFWYVGAASTESQALSNQGVSTQIQVKNQEIQGVLSFWISETFPNNLWAQVGYYIQNNSSPLAFYQIWNLTAREVLVTNTEPVALGTHTFSMVILHSNQTRSTIWSFELNGRAFGFYDLGSNQSSSTAAIYAMSEEGYTQHPFAFDPVLFAHAILVFKNGYWSNLSHAYSYGNSWGIQGQMQSAKFHADQFIVGEQTPSLAESSALWV
jgi:hypothetical protein